MAANASLGALRRVRAMRPAGRTPGLDRAVGLEAGAWRLWQLVAGQLVLAGRVTVGDGAAVWARAQLALWIENVALDDLDALADELVAERDEMRLRAVAA